MDVSRLAFLNIICRIQSQQMKKSPIKKTPQKNISPSKSRLGSSSMSSLATSPLYYCHYKNAMYMGGIKSFKKDGRGILLHDNGVSIISSYYNDLLHGHNIFFDNYSLASINFVKNKFSEVVYRIEGFLVYLNYNSQRELDGKALLLNYITKTIIHAVFKKGNMTDRYEETDFNVINRVFDLKELDFLIGRTHAKVMKYDFEKIPNIEYQKQGNKIIIGFEKNGFINGLGFTFLFRGTHGGYNVDTHRNQDEFELKTVERGYYINTQLTGMGEKMFKNGNFYVGQFRNGIFQGNGVLKNHEKRNWVSGYFKDGNLVELLEYNSEGQSKKYDKIIEGLHERKTNWINNEIPPIDFNFFVDEIEKIISTVPNRQIKTLEQRKQEVLKKIQEKFISDTNTSSFDNQISEQSLNQLKNSRGNGSSSVNRFINNFTPTTEPKGKILTFDSNDNKNGISFQANSPQKKRNSPKKLNIFERTQEAKPDRSLKKSHLLHPGSQAQSSKRLVHSPGWIKNRQKLASSREDGNMDTQSRGRANSDLWNQQSSKDQFIHSRYSKPPITDSGIGNPASSDRISTDNRTILDSKRMIGKNKIFRYLQNQDSQASPQFTYTKVDTLRDQESRHRVALQQQY